MASRLARQTLADTTRVPAPQHPGTVLQNSAACPAPNLLRVARQLMTAER